VDLILRKVPDVSRHRYQGIRFHLKFEPRLASFIEKLGRYKPLMSTVPANILKVGIFGRTSGTYSPLC